MFRFSKPGYRTRITLNRYLYPTEVLDSIDADSTMITVAGDPEYGTFLVGADGSPPLALKDWKIDAYETSNREYKAFVDAGGYRDSTWWPMPIRDGDRVLSWAEARARFVDQSGQPGPSTWVAR